MSKRLESSHSRRHSPVTKALMTTISAGVVAAVLVGLAFIPGKNLPADHADTANASVTQEVSPKVIDQYCPAQMGLADTGTYGDEEFQASVGDLTSSARYGAFGAIFHAQVSAMGDSSKNTVLQGQQENDDDATASNDSVVLASQDGVQQPQVFETRLLGAQTGTGASGAIASWATNGDIAGVSAASCVSTSLQQDFLVSSTKQGTTQQLLIANPTDKSTTVELTMNGTDGSITMATQSTLVVGANEQISVDLAAAASNQNAVYVRVRSQGSPVAAVVRTIQMDGLNADGNDFVMPLESAASTQVINLGEQHNNVTLRVFGSQSGSLNLSWITKSGVKSEGKHAVEANKVNTLSLKSIPSGALALLVESDVDVKANASIDSTNKDSHDFAVVNTTHAYAQSALTIPANMDAQLVVTNASSKSITVTFTAYDEHGGQLAVKTIDLDGDSARTLKPSDIAKNAVAITTDYADSNLVWGAFLTNSKVSDANVAGIAYIGANSLRVAEQTVYAVHDATIVH
ncbi:DUF5719 family protein [Bifidobacterium canis]|uniref:Organic solvents resistance ABC transporter permease n=1 Tax=Bifidobacterium canis TaxID=2610880 RepID=A0A7K1J2Z4_9BIFI|nr:DUF5719 family protein [Bifidobacterium canis]MUH59007.1 organic solvents resistance ABC transporter permease [Bifidobacterium canis]